MTGPEGDLRFRPLDRGDGARLGELFAGLSARSRATFGPHPLDAATAAALAAAAGTDGTRRIVGVDDAGAVIAYGIVVLGVGEPERARCGAAGVVLDPALDAMVAPVVSDDWQGRGVGTALLVALLTVARAQHRRSIALLGGVQVQNVAAMSLYVRAGFREVDRWEHPPGVWNADMVLDGTAGPAGPAGPGA